jgi:transcriptional regulator with XRE-family HTH domain
MATNAELIGVRLRMARKAAGLRIEEVSIAVRASVPTLYNWERGETSPPSDRLPSLADLYDVDVGYFFRPDGNVDASEAA